MAESRTEIEAAWQRVLDAPPAPWVQAMHEHHRKTGQWRASDLRRVMGDQTRGVSFGPSGQAELLEILAGRIPGPREGRVVG